MEETLLPKNEITELKESQENQISETTNQKPISIGKGIWDIVWKFLLAHVIFLIIPTIYIIKIMINNIDLIKTAKNNDIYTIVEIFVNSNLKWAITISLVLVIIVFTKTHWVRISFGQLKEMKILPFICILTILTISVAFFDYGYIGIITPYIEDATSLVIELETEKAVLSGVCTTLIIGILAPILEEIMFRGVLLGGLLNIKCHVWTAIILSGIIFGLYHESIIQFVGCTIFGIITGWLYCRTRSLIPGIVMHIINNSIPTIMSLIDDSEENTNLTIAEELLKSRNELLLYMVISLPLIIGCLWWLNKKLPKDKEEISNENLSVQTIS